MSQAQLAAAEAELARARSDQARFATLGQEQLVSRSAIDAQNAAATAALDVIYAVLRGYALDDDAATHAARAVRSALHGFVLLEVGGGFGFDLDLDESFARLVSMLDSGLRSATGEPDAGPEGPGTA